MTDKPHDRPETPKPNQTDSKPGRTRVKKPRVSVPTIEIRRTYPRHRRPWTSRDLGLLRMLVMSFIPWSIVSDRMGRTITTVQNRASSMGWLRERRGWRRRSDFWRI